MRSTEGGTAGQCTSWSGRFGWLARSAASGDTLVTIAATVGWRFVEPLSVFLAVTKQIPGSVALAADPGSDSWDFALVVRALI